MHCEYGFEEGDDGCQICKCKKPTKDNDGGKRQPAVFEVNYCFYTLFIELYKSEFEICYYCINCIPYQNILLHPQY